MRGCKCLGGAFIFALSLSWWSKVSAGIAVIAQDRVVHIDGTHVSAPTPLSYDDTVHADPTAPFTQSIQDSVNSSTALAQGSASQDSTLASNAQSLHLIASGSVVGLSDSAGTVNNYSNYYVVFSVDVSTPYTLTESGVQDSPLAVDAFDFGANLLAGQQPESSIDSQNSQSLAPNFSKVPYPIPIGPLTYTGILAPGSYTLEGGVQVASVDAGASASYSTDFALGSTTTSVPVPTSASIGFVELTLVSGAIALRRRINRRGTVGTLPSR